MITPVSGPRLVVAEGRNSREIGRSHGEQTADLIRLAIDAYAESFAVSHGLHWHDVTERATAWLPIIATNAPHLESELQGIAEGAGVSVADILALNARGEIVYDPTFANMAQARAGQKSDTAAPGGLYEQPEDDGCSSFALLPEATPNGHVYAGQNWDWRHTIAETVIALRVVQAGKPTIIMQAEAGQIGRQGANAAGIALNANGLGGRFTDAIGMPQAVIRRLILESTRFYDALRVPFQHNQQIAANLLLTHHGGYAIDLETTPKRHRWGHPEAGVLVHANHYEYGVPSQLKADYRPFAVDSLYRSHRLRAGIVAGLRAGATVENCVPTALSDHFGHPHGICRHPDLLEPEDLRTSTIGASLVDLTEGVYRFAYGQPCSNRFEPLPWGLYDGSADICMLEKGLPDGPHRTRRR